MKTFLTIFYIFLFSTVFGQTQGLQWNTQTIALGKVDLEGAPQRMVYHFEVSGDKAVQISRVEVSCNCTNPVWPMQKMQPGHKDSIVVMFKPKGFVGEVNNSIQVFNSISGVDDLNYTAEVYSSILDYQNEQMDYHPGKFGYFRLLNYELPFGVVANDAVYSKKIVVYNESKDKTLKIEKWMNLPLYLSVKTTKTSIEPQDTMQLIVTLDGAKFDGYGAIREKLEFMTNDIKYPKKSISFSTYIKPGFSHLKRREIKKGPRIKASEQTVNFGKVKSGSISKAALTLYNPGKSELIIFKTETDCNCAVVHGLPNKIAAGDSAVVTVSLDALYKHEFVVQNIDFIVNDPTQSVYTVTLKAYVLKK